MTQKIKKGNDLIANFIAWKIKDGWLYFDHPEISEAALNFDNYSFHESWDWLMPVIDKIENQNQKRTTIEIHKIFTIVYPCHYNKKQDCMQFLLKIQVAGPVKIENTWNAIVEYLKKYYKPLKNK